MAIVSSSIETRKRLRGLLAGDTGEIEASAFVRQAVRLMIEEALRQKSVSTWAGAVMNVGAGRRKTMS